MTSLNAISSSGFSTSNWQSQVQQVQNYFSQLGSSLSSGDLSGAQQAFTALQKTLPNQKSSNGNQGGDQIQKDFAALGQALQSGDLSGAQQAYSTLQSDMQKMRKGHPPGAAGSDPTSASSTSGATLDISISIEIGSGGNAGAGGTVNLTV